MYCGKCGSQNVDGAKFCEVCGAPTGAPSYPVGTAEMTNQISAESRHRKIGILAVGICIVVLLFGVFSLTHGRGAEKTAEILMDGILDGDATVFVELIPDELLNKVMKESGASRRELEEELSEYGEELQYAIGIANAFLGDNVKITYKVLKPESFSAEELRETKEDYRNIGMTIKAASWIPVQLSIRAGSYNDSDTLTVPVVQVGRSWYLDLSNIDELLY